jgi:hypothetical protein
MDIKRIDLSFDEIQEIMNNANNLKVLVKLIIENTCLDGSKKGLLCINQTPVMEFVKAIEPLQYNLKVEELKIDEQEKEN